MVSDFAPSMRLVAYELNLGNPNGTAALRRAGKGGAPLREAVRRNADQHAADLALVIDELRVGLLQVD